MSIKQLRRIKKNGIFYTPEHVAALLTSQAVNERDISILDPACGNGILLTEALRISKKLSGKSEPYLVGCDRFKQKNLDQNIKFVHSDFFKLNTNEQFDLILTNPPYIQSARIDLKIRNRYYSRYAQPLGLSSNLDLWVYFIIKCTAHLKKGGAIAAVLPWSFLEAEYAQKVRKWIADNFARINVMVLQGAHFKDTVKRVLLVWMQEYGVSAKSIKLGHADKCDKKPYFKDLPREIWNSKNAMVGLNPETSDIIDKLRKTGFRPLEEYANVTIGVVTGANKYFIRSQKDAAKLGFSRSDTLRILTSVEDLRKVTREGLSDKVLIQFNRMSKKKKDYLRKGRRLGLNKRVHCMRREKQTGLWYKINQGPIPDAFFSYRVSTIPYMIQNPDSYQCTNTLHKVIFKKVSETEQKWIQLSLLSLFGQLSLEMSGRHYGNGIIKIEPSVLKSSLVFTCKKEISERIYEGIIQTLIAGDKNKASLEATKLVAKEANIDDSIVYDVLSSLNELRARRGLTISTEEDLRRVKKG
jgi:tRNA1(Val) A37 N6-methylase TrmN6